MSYSLNGTEVIKSTGQIEWARIKNAPTFLTGVTAGVHTITLGDGVVFLHNGLRLVGTTVQGTRTVTDCNCVCDCSNCG